jgi:protein-tyrosine kinase
MRWGRTHNNEVGAHGNPFDKQFAVLARLFERRDNGAADLRSIGITSTVHGEGVSTVASKLAEHLAGTSMGRVLLVDSQLFAPTVHQTYRTEQTPGFAEAARVSVCNPEFIRKNVRPDLDVMTAGAANCGCSDQIAPAIPEFLDLWLPRYERIVFDLPSLDRSTLALDLAVRMDAVLMVVEAQRLSRDQVAAAKLQLQRAGAKVIGAVLNKHRQALPGWIVRRF